jgi:hypothetical protein
MKEFLGKSVVVASCDEITYRGLLVEIDEQAIHLEGETGWIIIPFDRILNISEAD